MAVQNSLYAAQAHVYNIPFGDAVKRKINTIIGGKDGQLFYYGYHQRREHQPGIGGVRQLYHTFGGAAGRQPQALPSPQLGQYYIVPYNDKKRGAR